MSRSGGAAQHCLLGNPLSSHASNESPQGQLVYYFQRVDRFKHQFGRQHYEQALRTVNLSKSAGLHGVLGIFVGMRVRLTKKVLAPELVQEASGEVVHITFHPEERFGHPASNSCGPAASHPCWTVGWVLCDYLPLDIQVRFDECPDDYTGLGKPGVWRLAPKQDTWELDVDVVTTIDHPGAFKPKRVKVTANKQRNLAIEVTSCQVPLTHEDVMTFNNIQGKTVRGPQGEPKGLVLDLFKPPWMGPGEYYQHLYMGLGRARKLGWVLLRNFPTDAEGNLDWSLFEAGPPDYLCEFLEVLEERARRTYPKLLRAQQELGFPAFENLPRCAPNPDEPGKFLYRPSDWGMPDRSGTCTGPAAAPAHGYHGSMPLRKRLRCKGPEVFASPHASEPQEVQAPLTVVSQAMAKALEMPTASPADRLRRHLALRAAR